MKKVLVYIVFTCIVSSVSFGFGSTEVEEAKFTGSPEQAFLSPKNKDGAFDTININFDGKVDIPSSLIITKFFFRLYDQRGTFLFEISKQLEKATSIPPFTFNGKRPEGSFLADGTYVYTVGIIDENEIESISQPYTIQIDNTKPKVFFSRVSSGNVVVPSDEKAKLVLEMETSPEVFWGIEAEGSASRKTYVLFNKKDDKPFSLPKQWEWRGLDENKQVVPDGDYVLNIVSKDAAGNSMVHKIETQIIVSSEGSFLLQAPGNAHFSPNSDGVKDTLRLQFSYPKSLRLGIDFEIEELVVQTISGKEVVRSSQESSDDITFNGLFLDGIPIPDDSYHVFLVLDNNNAKFSTNMVEVTIDTQEPYATFYMQTLPEKVKSGDPFYFGGETRESIDMRVKRLDSAEWNIVVSRDEQNVYESPLFFPVNSNVFEIRIPSDIKLNDRELSDGLYEISFYSLDAAGNEGRIGPFKAIKDSKVREVSVFAEKTRASAFAEPLVFAFSFDRIGISRFNILIRNTQNRIVRASRLSYGLNSFEWYARNDAGQPVPNGEYSFTLSIEYFNGDVVESSIDTIQVDSLAPILSTFSTDSVVMNPNSDSDSDKYLVVKQKGEEKGVEWVIEIRNIFDNLIYSQTFPDSISDFRWDGKDSKNKVVVDGDYIYRIIGRDSFGNETIKTISFVVDSGAYDKGVVLRPDNEMPKIYFPGFSDDIFSLTEQGLLYENLLHVRSIARLLKSYSTYTVTIVGHAAALLSGEAAEREQIEVLIPLSRDRSLQIKKAFQILGIDESRINIRAVGGSQPKVPKPSASTIWRNRRVEFELAGN